MTRASIYAIVNVRNQRWSAHHMDPVRIVLPVGRLIMGDVYKANDKDADGNPLLIKNGPNRGQPRVDFFMGVAIPKEPGHTHWAQTTWGAEIYRAGAAAFPQAYQSPAFAWKIADGDDQTPNTRGKRLCDAEGARGHWIVKMGGGYAPRVYQRDQFGVPQPVPGDHRIVKPGYMIQCQVAVEGNGSAQKPGMYLNHGMVLFVDYGPEIISGPDPSTVFGVAPGAAPAAAPAAFTPPPAAFTPPPVAVTPNPAILAPVLPPPVTTPPAPPARQMTAKAGGVPYEEFLKQGWTDALLVQHGYLVA